MRTDFASSAAAAAVLLSTVSAQGHPNGNGDGWNGAPSGAPSGVPSGAPWAGAGGGPSCLVRQSLVANTCAHTDISSRAIAGQNCPASTGAMACPLFVATPPPSTA